MAEHKCDWGPWHPWCSTYRCIHPGCHKNMPSAEVAKRLNEYETQKTENEALRGYATHKPGCYESGKECICGLDALLTEED